MGVTANNIVRYKVSSLTVLRHSLVLFMYEAPSNSIWSARVGVCSFCWYYVVRQKTERVDTTKSKVWMGNINVKVRKTISSPFFKKKKKKKNGAHTILQNFGKTSTPPNSPHTHYSELYWHLLQDYERCTTLDYSPESIPPCLFTSSINTVNVTINSTD